MTDYPERRPYLSRPENDGDVRTASRNYKKLLKYTAHSLRGLWFEMLKPDIPNAEIIWWHNASHEERARRVSEMFKAYDKRTT